MKLFSVSYEIVFFAFDFTTKKKLFNKMKITMKIVMIKWTSMVVLLMAIGLIAEVYGTSSGLHSEQSAPPAKVQMCRESCLKKVRCHP